MTARIVSRNPAVLSYYAMRKAVGLIALSLPFVLAGGSVVLGLVGDHHTLPHPMVQRSISDYYYTPMRNYLVGSLCAIAAFLACSRGYDLNDEITGYLAGLMAFGVGLVPPANPRGARITAYQVHMGYAHTAFAAMMFLVLSYFCIFLFRRSSPENPSTKRKRHRNKIYGACGLTMIGCNLALVALTVSALMRRHHPSPFLFWVESAALAAFGVAWLTKGEGILKDKPYNHNHNHNHVKHGENGTAHAVG